MILAAHHIISSFLFDANRADLVTPTLDNWDSPLDCDLPDAQTAPQDSDWDPTGNNLDSVPSSYYPPYDDSIDVWAIEGGNPQTACYDHLLQVWAVDSDDEVPPSYGCPHMEPEPYYYDNSLPVWAADSDDDEANNEVPQDPDMFILEHDEAKEEDIEGTYRECHPHLTGMCPSTFN